MGLCAAIALLAGCGEGPPLQSLACERVRVAAGGAALTGIEDMAVLSSGEVLLSAYNRRAPEHAPVGLFVVTPDPNSRAWSAVQILKPQAGEYPHGFALDDGERALAVIIRRQSGPPRLGYYTLSNKEAVFDRWLVDDATWQSDAAYPCSMNDTAFFADTVLVSDDRASCGGPKRWAENIFGKATGRVLSISSKGETKALKTHLFFPNGLAAREDSILYYALTRDRKIRTLSGTEEWDLPGAPDNITVDAAEPALWAATIPSLARYGLYRTGLLPGTMTSWIVKVTPGSTRLEVFETPAFEGATSVAVLDQHLVLSGAYTGGLALCERPDV